MVALACDELGAAEFQRRLKHVPGLADDASQADRVRRLLHCVYQSSHNSGPVTRHAAETLRGPSARECRASTSRTWSAAMSAASSRLLGRPLTWEADDIALQNIQARVRGPSVWLLANVKNALLLSTSNRSEAAVGYATMDGDTCGGLCPIAGIDKAFLLGLAVLAPDRRTPGPATDCRLVGR